MESFYRDVMLEKIITEIMEVKLEDVKKREFNKGKFWAYTNDGEIHSVPIKMQPKTHEILAITAVNILWPLLTFSKLDWGI